MKVVLKGVVLAAAGLALAGCAHKPVQTTKAMRVEQMRQIVLAGVGRTSKANGYFVRLTEDGKGKAWMKGETVSHAVTWNIEDGTQVGKTNLPDDLFICLKFGKAINFPNGHTFCTHGGKWDTTVKSTSVPDLES